VYHRPGRCASWQSVTRSLAFSWILCHTNNMNNEQTTMTITERNQKLYDLRKQKTEKELELAWIETEIMAVNAAYDREHRDTPLFEEMFGG